MRHTEYRLTVSQPILEVVTPNLTAVLYKVGSLITLDEVSFEAILSGETLTRYTQQGLYRFSKEDFENEVRTISVTVEEGVRRLRNK